MTIEDFDKTAFRAGMKVEYKGKNYDLSSVNFEEKLIGFDVDESDDDPMWARCENVQLL